MSKIEEILQKASKLREQGELPAKASGEKHRPASPPRERPAGRLSPSHLDAFSVENRLLVENPFIVTVSQPASQVAEEYKKLKSVLIKLTNGGSFKNTLMVTSTLATEGKSITSLNIAMALAQEYDHTVVLVDCDLRRPSIHNYLGIPGDPGLTDCLLNGLDVGKALVKTGIGRLSVLPAGTRVPNPAELMSSGRMREFIHELKHRYPDRYVVIDTPPVLQFAEAHAIGSEVDGVILVVREGHVPVAHLKEALGMLKDLNILGVVYNDAEINRYNSYHHYNYRYYGENGAA